MCKKIDELSLRILNIAEYLYTHELYNNTFDVANPVIREQRRLKLQSKIDVISQIRTLLMLCTDDDISSSINFNNLDVEHLRKYFTTV